MLFAKKNLNLDGYSFDYKAEQVLDNTDEAFTLNGKSYTTDYFQKILEVSTDDGKRKRHISENGETVLKIVERIPTFDSSDRMYDSYKLIYIIENNGKKEGIYLHGGYCLVDAVRYTGITAGDEKTRQMLEELEKAPVNV